MEIYDSELTACTRQSLLRIKSAFCNIVASGLLLFALRLALNFAPPSQPKSHMQNLYQSWLGHSRFHDSDEFRPFQLNSEFLGHFQNCLCLMCCCDKFCFVLGNLITKGGVLGYVRSIELSTPCLSALFSFTPPPPPFISIFLGYYSIQTVMLVLCLQMPGGELRQVKKKCCCSHLLSR